MAEDFEAYWPQSNEIFDRDSFIEVNRTYPGIHKIEILNVHSEHNQWDYFDTVISEVFIKSMTPEGKKVELFAMSIFKIEDDGEVLIKTAREYWAETYPAPEWRKHLSIQNDVRRLKNE